MVFGTQSQANVRTLNERVEELFSTDKKRSPGCTARHSVSLSTSTEAQPLSGQAYDCTTERRNMEPSKPVQTCASLPFGEQIAAARRGGRTISGCRDSDPLGQSLVSSLLYISALPPLSRRAVVHFAPAFPERYGNPSPATRLCRRHPREEEAEIVARNIIT